VADPPGKTAVVKLGMCTAFKTGVLAFILAALKPVCFGRDCWLKLDGLVMVCPELNQFEIVLACDDCVLV